ncbi:hypothetical protein PY310_05335 [Pseudarthrobacter sp. H3Y2-7]|uniref:hypothetical protein n=1 Tax=Pseudarthrobacter naphthalenicus TaxID=3031328 RepID=UPI0023B13879|nr:hypothetical protein [Pseudarthrobacter sp. H3Y2-7]MDE8668006.1 hypothetical protein [Pseudarthrobacter sp. H3Y2-7]
MTTTTLYPATVRELAEMAHDRGVLPSELLVELEPFPEVPAGYVLSEGVDGLYLGREVEAAGVVIIPAWNYRTQEHYVELWTGKGTGDEAMVILSNVDALQVAANLAAAAA